MQIKRIQNQIKSKGGYITKEQATRYLELVCKIRTDEEEAEKNQLLKLAANTEPPEEETEEPVEGEEE